MGRGDGSETERMDTHRSDGLVVVEVKWEQKSANGWLLREVFDLLLRKPDDLTDRATPPTMHLETVADEEGGE